MKTYYVYLHLKPNGDPFYVGKGFGRRSHELKRNRNKYHGHIITKHGVNNIEVLVFHRDSEAQALADEILWIRVLREYGYALCNMTDGGEGVSGCIPSAETRAKMSLLRKGRKLQPRSPEHSANISIAKKGKPNPHIGHKQSPEHIAKRVKYLLGNTHTYGKPWSDARRAGYIDGSQSGSNNGFFGRTHSEETRMKLKAAWLRRKSGDPPSEVKEKS